MNSDAQTPPTFDDIKAAAARIAGAVVRTPTMHSRTLSDIVGADVWLKFENLQFTAAYKERGALNKLLQLTDEERARGVVAASAGNHAQGLALAARVGPGWPLSANIAILGFANGVFAVAAIGSMMSLAGADGGREGTRMGLWGAAQTLAFGGGGLLGTGLSDIARALIASPAAAYAAVFMVEGLLFLLAARLAAAVFEAARDDLRVPDGVAQPG